MGAGSRLDRRRPADTPSTFELQMRLLWVVRRCKDGTSWNRSVPPGHAEELTIGAVR